MPEKACRGKGHENTPHMARTMIVERRILLHLPGALHHGLVAVDFRMMWPRGRQQQRRRPLATTTRPDSVEAYL